MIGFRISHERSNILKAHSITMTVTLWLISFINVQFVTKMQNTYGYHTYRPCVSHGRLPSAKTPSMGRTSRRLALSSQRAQETMEIPGRCRRLDASHQVPLPWPPAWCLAGLRYDITGIKRRRDDSSECAHPGAMIVNGYVPIRSDIIHNILNS